MKKTIILTATLLILALSGFSQDWIANGESIYSMRKKLNALKASFDSLVLKMDSIENGTKAIYGTFDTITDADKIVVADSEMVMKKLTSVEALIGSATNYASFDTGGSMLLTGEAKQFISVNIEPVIKKAGSHDPLFEKYIDDGGSSIGTYLYSFPDSVAGQEKEVFFTMQLPTGWDQDSIWFHVHWIPGTSATAATPRWGIEYTWIEPGGVFGSTTTVTATGNDQGVANPVAKTAYSTSFAGIKPSSSQDGMSAIIIGRLFRNSSNAGDTYDGKTCGLLSMDALIQVNSLGSNTKTIK